VRRRRGASARPRPAQTPPRPSRPRVAHADGAQPARRQRRAEACRRSAGAAADGACALSVPARPWAAARQNPATPLAPAGRWSRCGRSRRARRRTVDAVIHRGRIGICRASRAADEHALPSLLRRSPRRAGASVLANIPLAPAARRTRMRRSSAHALRASGSEGYDVIGWFAHIRLLARASHACDLARRRRGGHSDKIFPGP